MKLVGCEADADRNGDVSAVVCITADAGTLWVTLETRGEETAVETIALFDLPPDLRKRVERVAMATLAGMLDAFAKESATTGPTTAARRGRPRSGEPRG